MESRRVTLRDIAREAGVHYSTVSRGLSHHPSIPLESCQRLREIADRLGYAPDPMVSALSAYRTRLRKTVYHGNLGWITNHPTVDGWEKMSEIYRLQHEGARQRARELGYQLETFWLRKPELTPRRAGNILAARNIRGLLFPPQPAPETRIELDWPRFAAVTFGYSLASPSLHVISNNSFLSMQEAVCRARELGYRRLGLVVPPSSDERVHHGWTGGFLAQANLWPEKERIPILAAENITDPDLLLAWYRKHRPDAIICHHHRVLEALQKAGLRIPEEVGYLSQGLANYPAGVAGIDENPRLAGAAAVDILVGMLHRSEWGIPDIPHNTLIQGTWHEGKTLPPKHAAASPQHLSPSKKAYRPATKEKRRRKTR